MAQHTGRLLLLIATAICVLDANVSFAQGRWPQTQSAKPMDAATVEQGLKGDDPLGRIMAIRQLEKMDVHSPELMEALVELLWDSRSVIVPDQTVLGGHDENVSDRARAAFWMLGPAGVPELTRVLHGEDGQRASLAGKVLEEVLLGKSYDRPRISIDGGLGNSRIPQNTPKPPKPSTSYVLNQRVERALERARFEVWVDTLRADNLAHGTRPGDGVGILIAELDAYFVAFAPYVTQDKIRATRTGEEWKVLLEIIENRSDPRHFLSLETNAVRMIGQVGGVDALPAMLKLIETRDSLGDAASAEIAFLGAPAVEGLLSMLANEKKGNNWLVHYTLGNITDPKAAPLLIAAMKAPQREVRSQAAYCLGNLNDPSALEPLIELLVNDPEAGVRSSAAVGLRTIDDPKGLSYDALINAVKSDDSRAVRMSAISALQSKPATWDAALAILQDVAAHDPDQSVRRDAMELVAKIMARQNPQ